MESSPNRIIVEDLPIDLDKKKTTITKDFLKNLFSKLGNIVVKNVVIMNKRKRNGTPNAYAFVEFQTRKMAERAIKELNYTKIENVPIRLSFADPETSKIKESDAGKLLIKGLPPGIEVSHLHDLFANFGEIITCNIPRYYDQNDCTYHSRCYGFVQFRNPKDAEQACRDLNGALINGAEVTIELLKNETEETFTKVFIKGLPDSIRKKEDLEAFVSIFGEIQSVSLPLDEDQNPIGYGFCNMKKHEDAVSVVEFLNGKEIKGKKLECGISLSKHERITRQKQKKKENYEKYKGRNLYIRGFSKDTIADQLAEKFQQYGEIESLKIMRDENDNSKDFGFVCFKDKDDAKKCIQESVSLIFVNDKQVYTAMAMTKDERIRMTTLQQKKNNIVPKNQYQAPGMPIMSYPLNPVPLDNIMVNKTKRDLLRQETIKKFGNQNAQPYLKRLKDLSDEQVEALSADHDLLEKFYNAVR